MTEHKLKTWLVYYNHILSGEKTFEVRRNDRDFKIGDTLLLQEYDAFDKKYTGREIKVLVNYLVPTEGRIPGLYTGYCVMGITPIKEK